MTASFENHCCLQALKAQHKKNGKIQSGCSIQGIGRQKIFLHKDKGRLPIY